MPVNLFVAVLPIDQLYQLRANLTYFNETLSFSNRQCRRTKLRIEKYFH